MIKTLSPYYIDIPLTSPSNSLVCNSYTVQIFIWQGNITAVPSQSSYQKTRFNPTGSNAIDRVEIGRIVNDFIDFDITIPTFAGLYDSDNQAWVRFHVIYDVDPTVIQLQQTNLAIKGYGYFQDGANPTIPTNKILVTQDEYKVDRNGLFILPIKVEQSITPDYNADDYTIDYFIV
jgi:hypothetical protein